MEDPFREFAVRTKGLAAAQAQEEEEEARETDPCGGRFLEVAFEEGDSDASSLPTFLPAALARRVLAAGKLLGLLARAHRGYYALSLIHI